MKFYKLTPDDWCYLTGIEVLDPDGWRHDGKPWEEPLTYHDFQERVIQSTVKMPLSVDQITVKESRVVEMFNERS